MPIFLKQAFETDIDAFLTRFDSFADEVTAEFFKRLVQGKKYPNYGSALHNTSLVTALPLTMGAFQTLHNLRLASMTAHPRRLVPRHAGSHTRIIKRSGPLSWRSTNLELNYTLTKRS